ncbi:MAG: enoyl-CoA hydratase/isomerase family protein [Actinomycetes bacterium]
MTTGTTTSPLVETSIEGRLARLRLRRPEADNRVTVAMMRQLIDGIAAASEADCDVLLVTAEGDDFSVGRDQQERPEGMTKRDNLSLILEANAQLDGFAGIVVTAFRGRALGFGSGLVVQSDIALAAGSATLGFDEIQHGFAPLIVLTYLEQFVGPKNALDLAVTGRHLSAEEALRMGMVSRVVPGDELEACAEALVQGLLARDSGATRGCKRFLRDVRGVAADARPTYALDQMVGA